MTRKKPLRITLTVERPAGEPWTGVTSRRRASLALYAGGVLALWTVSILIMLLVERAERAREVEDLRVALVAAAKAPPPAAAAAADVRAGVSRPSPVEACRDVVAKTTDAEADTRAAVPAARAQLAAEKARVVRRQGGLVLDVTLRNLGEGASALGTVRASVALEGSGAPVVIESRGERFRVRNEVQKNLSLAAPATQQDWRRATVHVDVKSADGESRRLTLRDVPVETAVHH